MGLDGVCMRWGLDMLCELSLDDSNMLDSCNSS